MRIVGGRFGGRVFKVAVSNVTRPTTERAREGVASALDSRGAIVDCAVLDLFAGTGALGFELLSRGASRVVFVERDKRACATLESVARQLDGVDVTVLTGDVASPRIMDKLAELGPFGLVIADPPYADVAVAVRAIEAIAARSLVTDDAFAMLEHASRDAAPTCAGFETVSSYRYGDTSFQLLARLDAGATARE